jgi:hypothetical protein
MSLVVNILGRSRIEGGGRTIAGLAVNNKEKVWGRLTGTYEAYTQDTSGLDFAARDLKLETLDFLRLDPIRLAATDAEGIVEPTTGTSTQFSESDGFLVFQTIAQNGDRTVADTKAYTVEFEAFGDALAAPDLT